MVSLGQATNVLVRSEFEKFGTNLLGIQPRNQVESGARQTRAVTLTAGDADAIARECPSVLAVSPVVIAPVQMIYRNVNWRPDDVFGVGPDFLVVRNWPLLHGSFFTKHDVSSAAKVCVIGQTIVNKLFQTTNPIGETVRINNIPFRIIGVLGKKGVDLGGNDDDDVVIIPYTTVRKRLKGSKFDDVNYIFASARSADRMVTAEREIVRILRERHRIHPGKPSDFEVQNSAERLEILKMITAVMTMVLTAIAAISLLVGGIGIMNIMLVSITERTREIGIRMAVGARQRDILRQFLIESIVLSSLGGVAGILFGLSGTSGITVAINLLTERMQLPLTLSLPAAVISIIFAAAVGVIFGYYPARRASRMDPIEALRYE